MTTMTAKADGDGKVFKLQKAELINSLVTLNEVTTLLAFLESKVANQFKDNLEEGKLPGYDEAVKGINTAKEIVRLVLAEVIREEVDES